MQRLEPQPLRGTVDDRDDLPDLSGGAGILLRFPTWMSRKPEVLDFDAVIHVDETRAVEPPLERAATLETAESPETYPMAL